MEGHFHPIIDAKASFGCCFFFLTTFKWISKGIWKQIARDANMASSVVNTTEIILALTLYNFWSSVTVWSYHKNYSVSSWDVIKRTCDYNNFVFLKTV